MQSFSLRFLLSLFLAAGSGVWSLAGIQPFVNVNVFYAPGIGTYVETDILILGNGPKYVLLDNGNYKCTVEITLLMKQDSSVVAFEKYRLHSAESADTAILAAQGLLDRRRFVLQPGVYALEATFTDINNPKDTFSYTEPVLIDYDSLKPSISDIVLLDAYEKQDDTTLYLYVKNGYRMIPRVVNYYPRANNRLSFYAEIYHVDKMPDGLALVVSSVKTFREASVAGNLISYQKLSGSSVNPLLLEFDISRLFTGNYNLVIELRDKNNTLLAMRKLFFQRYNQPEEITQDEMQHYFVENTFVEKLQIPELEYHLKSLLPIANAAEANTIGNLTRGKTRDRQAMQRFLLYFWSVRNPDKPMDAWKNYQERVKEVNDNFGTPLLYGFMTDRGRVYLQYGPPTDRREMPREPGAKPYEIWQYNATETGELNVRFIFYNPDLVSNDYILLHSTASGEVKNEQWQSVIYGSFTGGENPVNSGRPMWFHFGSRTDEFFREENNDMFQRRVE